jgi:cell division protein FtsW
MSREQRWSGTFLKGFLLPFIYPGLVCLLIILEPDFGSVLLIGVVALILVFLGGAQIGYLSILSVLGMAGFGFIVMENDVRRRRIMAFLNPDAYAADEAFQLLQAKYAFVSGGEFGLGLGESLQKRFYLP